MFLCVFMLIFAQDAPVQEDAIKVVIQAFHQAASKADRASYFAMLSEDAVFLGTDGSERWTKTEFEATYGDYMDSGKGWTFVPQEQFITIAPGGKIAWFDEALSSEHYGPCRGSGVLVKQGERWLIAQYNLSVPMPNDLAKAFVAIIGAAEKRTH